MREEIKKGYVLKAAIIVIIISLFAIAMRYSWNMYSEANDLLNTIIEDQKEIRVQEEIDSIDAYMEHWYEVVDTNGNGVPDADEEKNIPRYKSFYDIPAGAGSIIIVKE
jgi:hypothetical protein